MDTLPILLLSLQMIISCSYAAARSSNYYYYPSSSSSSSSTRNSTIGSSSAKNYDGQFLLPQNAARAALGEPPLTWDNHLESYAQWYANQRRADCSLVHSNGPYGENIFWGGGDGWGPGQAVADWLSEAKWYNHWTNTCEEGEECGHYTQIVWRGTRRVGCARVVCDAGAVPDKQMSNTGTDVVPAGQESLGSFENSQASVLAVIKASCFY
ncbi:hypothetical protein Scep_008671 [Stephania cephalantha]|uniref:SCP domain-containing protein n=1 Tax=Stephania cephalantha TaxID=152367 RepID=A0AAP0KE45_9MAGN